jgi:hypothetical protein
MRHTLIIITSTIFLFAQSQAAQSDTTPSVSDLLSQLSKAIETRPYGNVLDVMQSNGELFNTTSKEESDSRIAAMDHAFWTHYADLKLQQTELSVSTPLPQYTNLIKLIRDPGASTIFRLDLSTFDALEDVLDIAAVKFKISCDLLFFHRPGVEDDAPTTLGEILLAATSREVNLCMDWYAKVLASKDAQSIESKGTVVGRLIMISDFMNEAAISGDLERKEKVKSIITDNIIANAGECPDRAISGLDDVELAIVLYNAPNLEDAVHYLLRSYKKQLIRECLVDHKYFESAQEYVYLLLLLNQHFNLDVCSSGIWSGLCGSRKSFDIAARKLMENLSVDSFCHYLAKHTALRSFIRSQTEHQDALNAAISDPDTAEDAVYDYMRRLLTPYLHERFVITGDKYQELTPDDLKVLKKFTPQTEPR